ncbi:MAG: nickel pincer cofactor biosynthesis protein LarC [Cyanobacteria bacterium NC_groundwater_1444_Ag_S-0.65um_54_12]|nr:nickel pincer cofactor biosynthesis protein LarC [Cyanobacteria bacterium NC_groundwater_1444_Ag_S-0.65um_54_12]
MRVAYFDCINGAAGDMLVGALLDAGADFERLQLALGRIAVSGYQLGTSKRNVRGMGALRFEVETATPQAGRHLRDIAALLLQSDLPRAVIAKATRIFHRLATAEGKARGIPGEQVQFCELWDVAAILEVVGVVLCLEQLAIRQVGCSPLPLGSGFMPGAQGRLPIPVPTVLELLQNVPVYDNGETGELVTPTGAAILTSIASYFGRVPSMRLAGSGHGAGLREGNALPNVLRVLLGEIEKTEMSSDDSSNEELVGVIETNLDEQPSMLFEYLIERLFAMGALDVFLTPVIMQRGRPGIKLTILILPERQNECRQLIFAETAAVGVRYYTVRRQTLEREVLNVQTDVGAVRVKVARQLGQIANLAPEYRDCAAIAQARGIPIKQVWQLALAQALATPQISGRPQKPDESDPAIMTT